MLRRKVNMAHREQQRVDQSEAQAQECIADEATAAGHVTFALTAPDAQKVSLCGTFNGWDTTKTPMQKVEKDSWKVQLKLPPGAYEYRMVVDGHRWVNDPEAKKQVPSVRYHDVMNCVREVFGGYAYDCGGKPLSGVCVLLTEGSGALPRTTRTDNHGYYCFDDLTEDTEYALYYSPTHYDCHSRQSLTLLTSSYATFKPDGKQFHMPEAYYSLSLRDQSLSDLEAELKKEIRSTKKRWEDFDDDLMRAAEEILGNNFDRQLQERSSEPKYIKDFKQQFKELQATGAREVQFLTDLLQHAEGQGRCPPADLASLISVEYLCHRTVQQMTNVVARLAGLCGYVHSLVPPEQTVTHLDVQHICDLLGEVQQKVKATHKLQIQTVTAAGMPDRSVAWPTRVQY